MSHVATDCPDCKGENRFCVICGPTPTPDTPPVDIARLRELLIDFAEIETASAALEGVNTVKVASIGLPDLASKISKSRVAIDKASKALTALRNAAPALLDEIDRLREQVVQQNTRNANAIKEGLRYLDERDKLREEVERLRASEAAMRLAILGRITLRESSDPGLMPIDYLAEQFPATVGHIPLNDWFNRLYRSVSPNAGTEVVAERDKLREERDASLALSVKTSDEALKDVQKIAVERDSLRQQNEQLRKEIEELKANQKENQ